MGQKTIAYTGNFLFPTGAVCSLRVLNIAKALRDAGYEVVFRGRASVGAVEMAGTYQGFAYANQPLQTAGPVRRLSAALLRGRRTVESLRPQSGDLAAILVYGSDLRDLLPALRLGRAQRVKVIADVVEWYDYGHLPGGRLGPQALGCRAAMTWAIPRTDGVVAISTCLQRYYADRGVRTIRVPPLVDLQEDVWLASETTRFVGDGPHLAYAGVPGKKDLIGNALRALQICRHRGAAATLHLIGPTRAQVAACLGPDAGLVESLGAGLVLHGRVDASQVPALLRRADFSVLLRPPARYAQAGFPTKFVESMAAGLPAIANLTSDLGEYLHDGVEGLIVSDHSVAACVDAITRASRLTHGVHEEMRKAARARAAASFDYRRYTAALAEFVGH